MTTEISVATPDLEPVFYHLECCDCAEEAALFWRVCAERDRFEADLAALRSGDAALRAEIARLEREIVTARETVREWCAEFVETFDPLFEHPATVELNVPSIRIVERDKVIADAIRALPLTED